VPAPSDYDDGEFGGIMIGRGNRSTRDKTCPRAAMSNTNPTCCPDANPDRRGGKPATNRLNYGTAFPILSNSIFTNHPTSLDSAVGTANGYGITSSSPGRVKNYLFHVVQNGSGAHPVSYSMGASKWCRGQKNVDLYIHIAAPSKA
jgi:hypothetical protein